MRLPKGYAGSVIIIDLENQKVDLLPTGKFMDDYNIDPRLWLGGDGFITKILWQDFPKAIDPLGPENEIIIAPGPWTATAAPQAGRAMFGCISPETGGFASGSFGWFFPSVLKYAGFDILIVRGKAKKPVYIFIDDRQVIFKDASHLWGRETGETVRMLREELEERYEGEIRVLSISLAGENLIKYSPPCADGTSCPGRSGGGAVMGSKNLKAIAVRGTGEIQLHDAQGLLDSSYHVCEKLKESEPLLQAWDELGASTALATAYNWPLNGGMLAENRKVADFPHLRNVACLNCANPCYHWVQVREGKHTGLRHLGGHMSFLTTCMANLGIRDFGAWMYYERLLQELGMDPASFTNVFAWAVQCYEKGLLSIEDTDGIILRKGDDDVLREVAYRVARREGYLGHLLADGVAEASKELGKGSEDFATHVKGKANQVTDANTQALTWAFGSLTSPRGADWLRQHNIWEQFVVAGSRDKGPVITAKNFDAVFNKAIDEVDIPQELKNEIFGNPPQLNREWAKGTKGKALFSIWSENLVCLYNSLVTCMFGSATQQLLVGFGPTIYSEVLRNITGWNMSYATLMTLGERVFNLQRLFNYRLKGWDHRNDRWSNKKTYETAKRGILRGQKVPYDDLLQDYYALRGWSKEGIPTRAKIDSLGLGEIVNKFDLPD